MRHFPPVLGHVILSNSAQKVETLKKNYRASRGARASVCNLAGKTEAKCHFGSKIQKFGPNLEEKFLKIKNFEVKTFSRNQIQNFEK